MANWSELAGGFEPTGYGEHVGASGVRWDGPRRRLRRETAAAGASELGEKATALSGPIGRLGVVRVLTTNVSELAVGSGTSWWRRISSAMSRRPELGKVTVCSGWRVPPRFLPLRDEDDDEGHAGHGRVASRAHWPRELTAMATAALGKAFPEA